MTVYIQKTVFSYDSGSKSQVIDTKYLTTDSSFSPNAENIMLFEFAVEAIATVRSLRDKEPGPVYSIEDIEDLEQ